MIYQYVGPEAIRSAAAAEPAGVAIRAPADLRRWIDAHPGALTEPATFVVTLDGVLRVAPRRSEHVACAGGGYVLGAGEIRFEPTDGAFAVAYVTNQSTGYCPDAGSWSAVAAALTAAGLASPDTFTHAFSFRRCDGCSAINLVKDDWLVCASCDAELPRAWNFPTQIAVRIRRASIDDAPVVAAVQVRAWRWAYGGQMPDAYLAALSVADGEARWRAQLAPDYRRRTFVAEVDGVIVGFATSGPSDDATLPSSTAQIYALYQEPWAAGTGVGRALLAHATNDLVTRGFTSAVLWVLDTNVRARRFYERAGWRAEGATRIDERVDHTRHELRYAKSLS